MQMDSIKKKKTLHVLIQTKKSEAIVIQPHMRDRAIAKQHNVVRLFFQRIHSSALRHKVPPSLVC